MELSPKEKECLNHRLTVPDALADALFETCAEKDVYIVCELLEAGKFKEANDHSTAVTQEVLIDCVEGSTWLRSMPREDRLGPKGNGAFRTLRSLANKLEKIYGKKVEVPRS